MSPSVITELVTLPHLEGTAAITLLAPRVSLALAAHSDEMTSIALPNSSVRNRTEHRTICLGRDTSAGAALTPRARFRSEPPYFALLRHVIISQLCSSAFFFIRKRYTPQAGAHSSIPYPTLISFLRSSGFRHLPSHCLSPELARALPLPPHSAFRFHSMCSSYAFLLSVHHRHTTISRHEPSNAVALKKSRGHVMHICWKIYIT